MCDGRSLMQHQRLLLLQLLPSWTAELQGTTADGGGQWQPE